MTWIQLDIFYGSPPLWSLQLGGGGPTSNSFLCFASHNRLFSEELVVLDGVWSMIREARVERNLWPRTVILDKGFQRSADLVANKATPGKEKKCCTCILKRWDLGFHLS